MWKTTRNMKFLYVENSQKEVEQFVFALQHSSLLTLVMSRNWSRGHSHSFTTFKKFY